MLKWFPFVLRSSYESLKQDYEDLIEVKLAIIADNSKKIQEIVALRYKLEKASLNDHRDPVTGQFTKATGRCK